MKLSNYIYGKVEELSSAGSNYFDAADYLAAVDKWSQAIDLLPDPKSDWEAFTWLSASIGDAYWQHGDAESARHSLFDALNGPDGQANPFVHYRLGQCNASLGDERGSLDHLLQAYMLDGEEIFHAEEGGEHFLLQLKNHNLLIKPGTLDPSP